MNEAPVRISEVIDQLNICLKNLKFDSNPEN